MANTTFDFQDRNGPVPAHRHINKDGTEGGWVANSAQVSSDAQVSGNARVFGNARISDDARVYGNARVSGDARVFDDARVFGNAQVSGYAQVYGDARVSDNARVFGDARVYGNARVSGDAQVSGYAWVSGDARVFGDACVEKTPICLSGLPHLITITDKHIQIGCIQLSFRKFSSFTEAKARLADGEQGVEFFHTFWPALQSLIDHHKQ